MRGNTIKTNAAIVVLILLAVGTGVTALIAILDQPPPQPGTTPQLAPLPTRLASVVPFDNPFLEFVGCRIKETFSLELDSRPSPPGQAIWPAQQAPVVKWKLAPDLLARTFRYAITVAPVEDPSRTNTVYGDRSVSAQSLMDQLARPGNYDIVVSAFDSSSHVIASADLRATIKPLPYTQISINDLEPNGTIRFSNVMQWLNLSASAMKGIRLCTPATARLENITDGDGNPLPFTTQRRGDLHLYYCVLNRFLQPGEAYLACQSGTETSTVTKLSGGVFFYRDRYVPGVTIPTRRIELCRLPEGAKLISASDNLVSQTVAGWSQLYIDTIIPPGGCNTIQFRYRM